jgi:hypothetical protein
MHKYVVFIVMIEYQSSVLVQYTQATVLFSITQHFGGHLTLIDRDFQKQYVLHKCQRQQKKTQETAEFHGFHMICFCAMRCKKT